MIGHVPWKKRWRATALHDAAATPIAPNVREASRSAPVLWRFHATPEPMGTDFHTMLSQVAWEYSDEE